MQHTLSFPRIGQIWLSLCFFFAFTAAVFGQQASLSVQGVLTKSDGTAVDDGEYSLTFKLWTAPTGGTTVHTETLSNVETVGGVYSVVLGINGTAITAPFNQTYYVGVSVGGGAELTPRPRLTHAPYAMALLGSSNTFPGSGAVTADVFKTPHGTPSSGGGYSFGAGGSTANGLFSFNAGNMSLYVNGTARMTFIQPGAGPALIDINDEAYFYKTIRANGGDVYSGSYGFLNAVGATGTSSVSGSYSIAAVNRIRATQFDAFSDRRIKKDFRPSDKKSDLATLLKLRVTDYRHIDEVAKGKDLKKGFIAQEVEETFPEAVSKTADFIPNIYEKSVAVSLGAGGKLQVILPKKHELKTGDQVRLIFDGGQKELRVAEILNENSFAVEGWEKPNAPEWVFAYGKKVDDFRQVDYDRIHTLNVSATQELARKVEILEKENAALRAKNAGFESQLSDLARRVNLLENQSGNARNRVGGSKSAVRTIGATYFRPLTPPDVRFSYHGGSSKPCDAGHTLL